MYDLIFDEKAIEFLEKLPKLLRKRIYNKIISAKEDSLHYFFHLKDRT